MQTRMESSNNALIFKDARFFLAAVGEKELANISSLITSHGGKILNYISDSPTYVVTALDDAKAPEVSEAIDVFCVPVVHVLWVKLCCAWNRLIPSRYFELARSYILRNVCAVVSESLLQSADKYAIWALLTFNGGRLVAGGGGGGGDNVSCFGCTHAIVSDTTEIGGLNIDTARVCVTTPDWLTDSVKAGARKPEFDYHPAHLTTAAVDEVAVVVPVSSLLPTNTVQLQSSNSNGMFSSSSSSSSSSVEQQQPSSAVEQRHQQRMSLLLALGDETKQQQNLCAGGDVNNMSNNKVLVKSDTKSALAKLLSDRQQQLQHQHHHHHHQLTPGSSSGEISGCAALAESYAESMQQLEPRSSIVMTNSAATHNNTSSNSSFCTTTIQTRENVATSSSGLCVAAPVLYASSPSLASCAAPAPPLLPPRTAATTTMSFDDKAAASIDFVTLQQQQQQQLHPHPLLNQMLSNAAATTSDTTSSNGSSSSNALFIMKTEQSKVAVHCNNNSSGGSVSLSSATANGSSSSSIPAATVLLEPAAAAIVIGGGGGGDANDAANVCRAATQSINSITTAANNSSSGSGVQKRSARKSRKREVSQTARVQCCDAAACLPPTAKRIRGESLPPPVYCTTTTTTTTTAAADDDDDDDDDDVELPNDLFFTGCLFYLARTDLLRAYRSSSGGGQQQGGNTFICATEQLIIRRGGKIVTTTSDDGLLPKATFIVCVQVQREFFFLPTAATRKNDDDDDKLLCCSYRHVTPDWLWTCDSRNRFVPPETLLHVPVHNASALAHWRVCFANFSTVESRLLMQYAAALGAYTCEYLTRDCSVVVCKTLLAAGGSHKFTAAYEWGIPTVSCAWLAGVMLRGATTTMQHSNFYDARYQQYAANNTKSTTTDDDSLRALKIVEHRQLAEKGQLMHAWLAPVRVTREQMREAREYQAKRVIAQNHQQPPPPMCRRFSVDLYEERVRKMRSDLLESTILDHNNNTCSSSSNMVHNNSNSNASSTLNNTTDDIVGPSSSSSVVVALTPPVVTLTGFTVGETHDLRERLLRLGAHFVDEVSGARVLIADAPKRTLKFLAALNCCAHIVTTRWLDACEHAGKLLTDDAALTTHSLSSSSFDNKFGKGGVVVVENFDLRQSLRERAKMGGTSKVFSKMAFHIAPAVEFGRGSLEYLIETGGGSIEQPFKPWSTIRDGQRADANCRIVAIGHASFPDEYRYLINHGIAVYSAEFILEAVARQSLDFGRNRIDKPLARPGS